MKATSPGLRATFRLLAIATPIAILLFLALGGWFDSYHGQAVSWRPIGAESSAQGMRRVLVMRPGNAREEHVLPPGASKGLPLEPQALPPINIPADAPVIHKDPFGFSVTVAENTWSTLKPIALLLPILGIFLAVLARNLFTTGSVFRLDPSPTGPALPGLKQAPQGQPVPKKQRSKKGPPPTMRSKKGRKRR